MASESKRHTPPNFYVFASQNKNRRHGVISVCQPEVANSITLPALFQSSLLLHWTTEAAGLPFSEKTYCANVTVAWFPTVSFVKGELPEVELQSQLIENSRMFLLACNLLYAQLNFIAGKGVTSNGASKKVSS